MRAYYGLLPALTHLIPQQPHEERNLNIPILQMKQLRQKKKKIEVTYLKTHNQEGAELGFKTRTAWLPS